MTAPDDGPGPKARHRESAAGSSSAGDQKPAGGLYSVPAIRLPERRKRRKVGRVHSLGTDKAFGAGRNTG